MKPNVPSAPALPVFPPRDELVQARRLVMPPVAAPALPTELQIVLEDFRRLRARLIEGVIPPLNDAPARWKTTSSDPFIVLETTKANRLLADGRSLGDVAGKLAYALIARQHGVPEARRALMRAG